MTALSLLPRVAVHPPVDDVLAHVHGGIELHDCEGNSARYIKAVLAQSPTADCKLVGGLLVQRKSPDAVPIEHVWVRINGRDYDPEWHLLVLPEGARPEYVELFECPLEVARGEPPDDEEGDWERYQNSGLIPRVSREAARLRLIPTITMR